MELFEIFIASMIVVMLAQLTYLTLQASKSTSPRRKTREILLDTSVLMDGRIIAVAKTGFIGGTIIVPRSVIGELQFLADAADHEKRARARHGLDVVAELQALPDVDVEILQDGSKADEGVDERLLSLAKSRGAMVCTLDYNLNKVAVVENIAILNVNELAQSLRMAHLPGENLILELVQKGQDSHQAVGYLPDGTMVVVEHANKQIGQAVEVEVIRSLQTAAGRMMFAKPVTSASSKPRQEIKPAPKKQSNGNSSRRPNGRAASNTKVTKANGGQSQQQTRSKRPIRKSPEDNLINLIKKSE